MFDKSRQLQYCVVIIEEEDALNKILRKNVWFLVASKHVLLYYCDSTITHAMFYNIIVSCVSYYRIRKEICRVCMMVCNR